MVKKILVGCCVFAFAASAFAQGAAPAAKPAAPMPAKTAPAPAPAKTAAKPAAAQAPAKSAEKAPAKAGEKMAAEMPTSGPMSRKVTHEAQDKKAIGALFKSMDDAWKKGDMNAVAALVDFPVLMITDNSKGEFMQTSMDKDTWLKDMQQSMEHMPKNVKMSARRTVHMLSDSLATVDEQMSMSMGKMHGSWNGTEMVVNKDGKWLVKMMAEAGWGDAMGGKHAAVAPTGGGAMGQAGK